MHSSFVIILINKLSTTSLPHLFVNAMPSNHRIIGEVTTYPLNKVLISMLIFLPCQIVNERSIYWYICDIIPTSKRLLVLYRLPHFGGISILLYNYRIYPYRSRAHKNA